jgi:hypothetical protein
LRKNGSRQVFGEERPAVAERSLKRSAAKAVPRSVLLVVVSAGANTPGHEIGQGQL